MTARLHRRIAPAMTTTRRTFAATTVLLVAVGWVLVVTQVVLYPGEFIVTTIRFV